MRRTWMVMWVCVLSLGVGVALAQSNAGTPAAGTRSSGAANGQGAGQPPVLDRNQRPRSQPAGSNAQASQANQTGPGNVPNPKSERGAGGVSVVWLVVGIVGAAAVLYLVARSGGMDRDVEAVHTRRADEIDREKVDKDRAA